MVKMLRFFIGTKFLIFSLLLSSTLCDLTVKYAAVIYRHGDRTPVDPYPTDPWRNESYWPVKFGQLTNIGKRQHYALGQWLRKRYEHLLSDQYDPTEIHIRATDVDRTLMSAQANLAGMFPPTGNSIWNKDLMWQPIPIHTKPEKDDELLAMKRICMPYIHEKEKYRTSLYYRDRLSRYQHLMDYLTTNTGRQVRDYEDIDSIYGVLLIERLYNFTLPGWAQAVFPDTMREPACYSFSTSTATPLMARLMVGPLLTEIVGQMKTALTNKTHLKLSMYSAHDFTIGNILSALRLFDGKCPTYTATIFFELIQDSASGQAFVRVSYRNAPGPAEPRALRLPHCDALCAFDRFQQLLANLLTVDWEHECHYEVPKELLAVGAVVLFLLVVLVVEVHLYTRRDSDYNLYTVEAVPGEYMITDV